MNFTFFDLAFENPTSDRRAPQGNRCAPQGKRRAPNPRADSDEEFNALSGSTMLKSYHGVQISIFWSDSDFSKTL